MKFLDKAINHEISISKKYVPVFTVLMVVLLGTALYFTFASGFYVPPTNPPQSILNYANGTGVPNCWGTGNQQNNTLGCFNQVESATEYARAHIEPGIGQMFNSNQLANLTTMPVSEQLLIISNMERIQRGLPAIAGVTQQLSNVAQYQANSFTDDVPGSMPNLLTGGVGFTWGGANWGDCNNAFDCNYEWAYDDGPGGTNLLCQNGNFSGCWGHRDITLTNAQVLYSNGSSTCPNSKSIWMGAAYSSTASAANGSVDEVIYCATGTPTDVTLTWGSALAQLNGASLAQYQSNPLPGIDGYWQVASDGGIFSYGNAQFHGSAGGIALNWPVVGMAPTPDGGGYQLGAADGGIFAYGDAPFHGSCGGGVCGATNGFFTAMAAPPNGAGYWLTTSTGQIYSFNVPYYGGASASLTIPGKVVGMAADASSSGYWLVNNYGNVYAFGNAPFLGNAPSGVSNIVGITAAPNGSGYWLVGSDGGVFAYGSKYYGSVPGLGASIGNAVGINALQDGGYAVCGSDGASYWFSSSGEKGYIPGRALNKPVVGCALSSTAQAVAVTTLPAVVAPPPTSAGALAPGLNQAYYSVGADGNLWQNVWTGSGWSGYRNMGNPGIAFTGGVADSTDQYSRQNLYAIGIDGNLWVKSWNGFGWLNWTSIGHGAVKLTGAVAAGRNANNYPALYAIGSDGNIWYSSWSTAGWSSWISIGNPGSTIKSGLATRLDQGSPVIFATGSDGNVYKRAWNGSVWTAWVNLSHPANVLLNQGVSVDNNSSGNPNLFATGSDGAVWQDYWTGTAWSGWQSLGKGSVALKGGVSATFNQLTTNNMFATGSDGNVWQQWWSGTAWSGWYSFGSGPTTFSNQLASPPYPLPGPIPPSLTITSPVNGATISKSSQSQIRFSGTLTTFNGLKNVIFLINGVQINQFKAPASTSGSIWNYNWDLNHNLPSSLGGTSTTPGVPPGTYKVTFQAVDNSGNISAQSITITITK